MANPSNPNGANQYQLDPRQKLCWDFYIDPKSETFGNGTQSAIKAGYEPDYADQITTVPWFKGKVRKLNMLNKAEENLQEVQDLRIKDDTGRVLTDVLRERNKVDTFVAATLGKNEGYSTRHEVTGADGEKLFDEETTKKSKSIVGQFLGTRKTPRKGE